MTNRSDERRRRHRLGLRSELLCAIHLRLRGYRILARRFRVPAGEIDIVARRGRVVAFVEVKARGTLDEAAESVTPRQRRRIRRAAEAYLATHAVPADCDLRFDVMLLAPGRWPCHVMDAWRD